MILAHYKAQRKDETLALMARLLDFDDSDKQQVGLLPSNQSAILRGASYLASWVPTPHLSGPAPTHPSQVPIQVC